MSLIECPKCQTEVSSDSGKCPQCRFKLHKTRIDCPECGGVTYKAGNKCIDCGFKLKAFLQNNTKCPKCSEYHSKNAFKCNHCDYVTGRKSNLIAIAFFITLFSVGFVTCVYESDSGGGGSYRPPVSTPSIHYSAADKVYACRAMIATNNAWGRTTPLIPWNQYEGKLLSKDKVEVKYYREGKTWTYNCHISDDGSNSQWSAYSYLREDWTEWRSYIKLKRTKTKLTVTANWAGGVAPTIKTFKFPK